MAIETHRTQESPQEKSYNKDHSVRQATFAIEGMTCASCSMRVEKGLKKVPGVTDAQVNLATEKATVTYDPTLTGMEPMMHKVEAVGYKATPVEQPASHVPSAPTLNTTPESTSHMLLNV